ncbi:KOW motif containing protein [Ophiocordyceps camponoti-floridani]|uniref:KOW motif containing protein n=1 Tax=Ophiocordyceps camponoti-floridani TaxID=2030778 RepID=A0A8H4Q528_9HYPO|nr:KOW motif containing protein [Ophiocordyceps camponoti-floridani]
MQKLLKRTAQAERQVARRMKKRMKEEERADRRTERPRIVDALRSIKQNNKAARQAWIENWELGPLAPKRDLGCNDYGVIWENYRRTPPKPSPQVVEQRCGWAGGPHVLCLAPGDRVLIMDGPDRGKIDCIKEIQHEHGTVKLETRHKGLFGTPIGKSGAAMDFPLSIGSIRLVYPLPHPETGQIRDVVIQRLKAVPPNMRSQNMSLDRWEFGRKWDRMVPGISVVIPWPEGSPPQYEANKCDTLRDKVEERTFLFNLTSPPMPPSVLDELRNKYSKFRTRHEDWYVQKKEAEEAAKKAKATRDVLSMRTPMDEFAEKRRQMRLARPEPLLTDEMLERIGRIMLTERERGSKWKEGEPPRVVGGPNVGPRGVGPTVSEAVSEPGVVGPP